jgi:hypothetical protein
MATVLECAAPTAPAMSAVWGSADDKRRVPPSPSPWPQPADWPSYAVDRQQRDPGGVLAFTRAEAVCVVNLAPTPADLPAHSRLLLGSGPPDDAGRLHQDTAAWLYA